MPVVMDAERISRALTRIAHEILEHNRGLSNLALVGVRSRALKTLAAHIRKRVKREVQTHLWPVFSSVQIERATSLAFTLLRLSPTQAEALEKLAQHYFPNAVRLDLILGTLDKQHRLEVAEKFSANKVVRNLREVFESVTVTATRRLNDSNDSHLS